MLKLKILIFCLGALPLVAISQNIGKSSNTLFDRKYQPGEIYRYKLTTNELYNGKWHSTTVSICELHVVKDSSGIPYDEVHWLSEDVLIDKGEIDKIREALAVKPYRISLYPGGRVDIPKLEVADMTGPITDFNTFFVAVSPLSGATQLTKKDSSISKKKYAKGNFKNGKNILEGEDCLAITVTMVNDTNDQVTLHTAFMPPAQPCLSYKTEDMNTPVVKDTINNFQMIQLSGNKQLNVQFGMEWFYINSTIRKSDGKIISSEMMNRLILKLKVNCNNDYKTCQMEMPFTIERKLQLELLGER